MRPVWYYIWKREGFDNLTARKLRKCAGYGAKPCGKALINVEKCQICSWFWCLIEKLIYAKRQSFKKVRKNEKKCLTSGNSGAKIAKLSQRDGSRSSAESRPREGKELAREGNRSEGKQKKILKNRKKCLTKRTRCDTIIWLSQTRTGQRSIKFFKKISKTYWQREADVIE